MQPEAGREAKKMKYVGVDIGKWRCRAAVMDPEGTVIDEFAFNNDAEGIRDLASRLTTEDRVVMESTGSVWTNLYDALDERKVPVVLANPLKTRAIARAGEFNKWLKMVFILLSVFGGSFSLYVSSSSSCTFAGF
jgi:hypothetical protein